VTIFDGCQYLKLTSSVVYSQKFCPALLKGAQMNIFEIEGVSDSIANKNFTVLDLDTSQPDANLQCNIGIFKLNGGMLHVLDTSVLNPDMLLQTESIQITDCYIGRIQPDLFLDNFIK